MGCCGSQPKKPAADLKAMQFRYIELNLNGVKLEYDVKGGHGWFSDEKQKRGAENADLNKRLEEEQQKLTCLEVELRAAALVVAEHDIALEEKIKKLNELKPDDNIPEEVKQAA